MFEHIFYQSKPAGQQASQPTSKPTRRSARQPGGQSQPASQRASWPANQQGIKEANQAAKASGLGRQPQQANWPGSQQDGRVWTDLRTLFPPGGLRPPHPPNKSARMPVTWYLGRPEQLQKQVQSCCSNSSCLYLAFSFQVLERPE